MLYRKVINIISVCVIALLSVILYQHIVYISLKYEMKSLSYELYQNDILYSTLMFIFTLLLILYITKKIDNKIMSDDIIQKKYINDLFVVNNFYKTLRNTYGLKNISKTIIEFITAKLGATSGLLYIVNEKNRQLQLLDGYNTNLTKTAKMVDMYRGVIGEAFATKKIKSGKNKYVTTYAIPLVSHNKTVGIIELKFFNKADDLHLKEQDETIIRIISNHISKELEHEKNKKYFDLIDKFVLISSTNAHGEITYSSDAFCKATGYSKKELLGQTHKLLRHSSVDNKVFQNLWNTIKVGKIWKDELPNFNKKGGVYWAKTTIYPEFDFYGNIIGYDAIREDITDKKLIEQISITDALTSLYNRRYFDDMFTKQINLSKRIDKKLVFGILDIDHFKQYNDTYGHQLGDKTLKAVANSLDKSLKRDNDLVFRLGGEEFGILYFIENNSDALTVANEARKNIEDLKIEHINNSASKYITISIGLFMYEKEDITPDQIYKFTDDLLYQAKTNGRNQVVINNKKGINDK